MNPPPVPSDIVMIIRHGEKPTAGPGSRGVTLAGKPDRNALSPIGWVRSGALLGLFAPDPPGGLRDGLFRPASVFASNPRGQRGSDREEQTVAVLAWKLGVELNTDHPVGEERALVKSVGQAASPRLICWEHRQIPVIAALLGCDPPAPHPWPKPRFDLVWVLSRDDPAAPYRFAQVPELLLPGDSDQPIQAAAN